MLYDMTCIILNYILWGTLHRASQVHLSFSCLACSRSFFRLFSQHLNVSLVYKEVRFTGLHSPIRRAKI